MCTVDQLMDEVEQHSDVDIIGITDHDDCRSFAAALDWKARHPQSRVEPIWGSEVTAFGFTHVLAYKMQPPYPTQVPKKFLALPKVVSQLKDLGCFVVVPHVDAPMVGMNRSRLARTAARLGFHGYELLTPYFTSAESLPELQALGDKHHMAALGGSDAHFKEDLYRVILHFPGHSPTDFERSWHERTVLAKMGQEGPKKTLTTKLRQQRRSLVGHPSEQVRSWMRGRISSPKANSTAH
jgi:predicted metal-dependent phosphoesterase TrpH